MREIIEKERTIALNNKYRKIIEEGGAKSQYFWKIRRQVLGSNKPLEYDTITEDDKKITDPEASKKYIADFSENLYQGREASEEERQNTKEIEKEVERLAQSEEYNGPQNEIQKNEINKAIKSLKKGKSMGPDEIPNEAIIEMDTENREALRKTLNKTLQEQKIPKSWETGTITRLYKGKGTKGKCSNERGITVSSNMGKLFERIINTRAKEHVTISDAQAGGKEKRATTDHLLILKEIITSQKEKKKPIYIAYLDVTKAYDKAWLTGIMYALNKNGLKGPIWNIVRKLNLNLKGVIKTKDGPTRTIAIQDSIRQGGVLSVLMYALLMDEIAKELKRQDKGCPLPPTNEKIGCLLWMDDVVLLSENDKELQEMLDITNNIAKRYHIVFGKEKSKIMTTNKKNKTTFRLGNTELEKTDKYKYLGEIINEKHNLEDQIKQNRMKSEGALQTILGIAKDPHLKGIEMDTVWKLLETCIIPILTYGCETWAPLKKEYKELNRILDQIIKRILMIPTTTPREALYIETGLTDMKHMMDNKRIQMEKRLEKTKNDLIDKTLKASTNKSWQQKTNATHEEYGTTKDMNNTEIRKKSLEKFKHRISSEGAEKSKIRFLLDGIEEWTPGKRQPYLKKLNRKQASLIFKLRNRMINVKRNFKNTHNNLTCRGCYATEETQEHVLEICQGIHTTVDTKIYKNEYFTEDIDMLRETCKKVETLLTRLEQSVAPTTEERAARHPGAHSTS